MSAKSFVSITASILLIVTGLALLIAVPAYSAPHINATIVNVLVIEVLVTLSSVPWAMASICAIIYGLALVAFGCLPGLRGLNIAKTLIGITAMLVLFGLLFMAISYLSYLTSRGILFIILIFYIMIPKLTKFWYSIKITRRLSGKLGRMLDQYIRFPEYAGLVLIVSVLIAMILNCMFIIQY